jgi:FkbM family methyltransferase
MISDIDYVSNLFTAIHNLTHDGVYFDIGANVGGYVETFQHLSAKATIHAFEPHPESFEEMKRRCADKSRFRTEIVLNQLGIDFEPGGGKFRIFHAWSLQACPEGFEVKFTTIDKYVEEKQVTRLDLIKLDVDGYEMRAFLGGQKSIDRFRPYMMVELSMMIDWYGHGGYPAIVAWLYNNRFRVFRIYGQEYSQAELLAEPLAKNSSFDVLCIPSEKFDALGCVR